MKYIGKNMALLAILVLLSSCYKEENFADREHYKYVVYLLSENSYNIHSEDFPYNDGSIVTGYFSIGCGGSRPNPEQFTVELEPDTLLFDRYNRFNFDIDSSKFAHILAKDRYTIESNSIVFPAKNQDQYVKVAVALNPDGLSPDSTYFIPIAIKSLSKYEVNPTKSSILLRIGLNNYYANHLTTTYYQMRGSTLNEEGEAVGIISATKLIRPISKNKVRLFAGSESQIPETGVDLIKKHSILLTIDDERKITIEPYGTIQVEQLPGNETWNRYIESPIQAGLPPIDKNLAKYIYLHYKYRTLNIPATEDNPAQYSSWHTVKEVLRKLE